MTACIARSPSTCHSKPLVGEFIAHIRADARARSHKRRPAHARAHLFRTALWGGIKVQKTGKPRGGKKLPSSGDFIGNTCRRIAPSTTYVYNFSPIKNSLTYTCAHTPTTVPLSLGRETLSWNSLRCVSRLTESLTPAAAAPASCPPRRFPCCVAPGSRRASVRSPPCSHQRSLIFRRRTAQPLSLCSPPLLNWLTPRLFQPLPPRRGGGGAHEPAGWKIERNSCFVVFSFG